VGIIANAYDAAMPTPQRRINSGFGPRSTATDVLRGIDLSGRLAIVTIAEPTVAGSPSARVEGVDAHAIDADAAAHLWTVSAQLTGANAFATA
jgi:hypothetical protein